LEYLNIKIVGHGTIKAFPNKKKTEDKHPDFVSNGVAVWKATSRSKNKKLVE
jgi:hypothetical protein